MSLLVTILPDEKALFARIAKGDETAFTQVFHHYNQRLYPFVYKMIKSEVRAEEIVQEVFTKLWIKRESLAGVNSPQSFIFTMATNRTLDELKKISNESRLIQEVVAAMDNITHSEIEEWFDGKETEHLVQEAVDALPPQRQRIYKLSREEGKSYKEIAEELGISPRTVQGQLIDAIKSIKEYLKNTPGGSLAILFFICEVYRPY